MIQDYKWTLPSWTSPKTFIQYPNRNYYKKFGDYGIRGPINNWLNMFLANRKMKVVVEREQSSEVIIASGVP